LERERVWVREVENMEEGISPSPQPSPTTTFYLSNSLSKVGEGFFSIANFKI